MANAVELSIPKSNFRIPVQTGLFINNEFVPSVDNIEPIRYKFKPLVQSLIAHSDFHSIYNPSTEELLCTVTAGNYLLVMSLASLIVTTSYPSL